MVAVPFDLAFPGWCRRMCRKGFSDVVHAALLAAGTRIEYKDFHGLIGPLPIPDFRQVVSMFADVLLVLNELVAQELFEMCAHALQARDPVDYIACEVKSIQIVQDCHIEGSRRRALFLISADVEVVMIGAPISQAVNQPGIAVIGKDDRLVDCEDGVELTVGKSVWMFG